MAKASDYKYGSDVEAYRRDTPPLIMRFLESESVNDRSPNTIRQHYYTLKNFYKFVSWRAGKCGKGCARLETITDFDFEKVDEEMILGCRKQDIEDYRAYMRKKTIRPIRIRTLLPSTRKQRPALRCTALRISTVFSMKMST